jgi:hypothetical protein
VRHLGSILFSLIVAPVIYLLIAVGVRYVVDDGSLAAHHDYVKATIGVLALLGAALLYCVLVLTRLSPVGPVLAGLAFLVVSAWIIFASSSFVNVMPIRFTGVSRQPVMPAGTEMLLLAVPLVLTVVSPRRWRRYGSVAAPAAMGPVSYPAPPGYQAQYPPPAGYRPGPPATSPMDSAQQLDPTKPLYPPPIAPPVMQPPIGPAPVSPPVDPDAPTHRFGL